MSLPEPSASEIAHSQKLTETIQAEIATKKCIPFSRFMELALYAPGLGYYSAGATKFGAAGDFVTAPEISPLFSQCLAQACLEDLKSNPQFSILEIGAGSGKMAFAVLQELSKNQALPQAYFILEPSADLQERQKSFLKAKLPHFFSSIHWLTALPEKFHGIVFANEVIDAFPVEIFRMENKRLLQAYVDFDANNNAFKMKFNDSDAALRTAVEKRKIFEALQEAEGYQSEVNLWIEPWVKSVAKMLTQGKIFLIDYGFERSVYYHLDRDQGTLMCHYRHRAHSDPFFYLGLQDITAHVDFTTVMEAAGESGLQVLQFSNQAQFLLENGLLTFLPDPENTAEYFSAAQAVKTLTLPSEMGELFKVLVLTK